jgi:Mn-dependent DtxR family transcriptional regulator
VASLTIENYVKAIYQLSAEGGGEIAATGQLAETLGVSPGTVTSMLKTLGESGLAKYTPYEGARLTDAGRSLALRVLRRHRLIELFLVQTLKLTWDEVHAEAENAARRERPAVDRIDAPQPPESDRTVTPSRGPTAPSPPLRQHSPPWAANAFASSGWRPGSGFRYRRNGPPHRRKNHLSSFGQV